MSPQTITVNVQQGEFATSYEFPASTIDFRSTPEGYQAVYITLPPGADYTVTTNQPAYTEAIR